MTTWVPGTRCGNVAARWSNPSGSIGVHRFRVWPEDEDRYNHIELAQNWEKVDAMIGVAPDGSTWPATTGLDGGLYDVINTLQGSILPVGMMFAWNRPSPAIPLPVGFAICDGTTLSASQHDFPGIVTSVVLPDMRNRFVLGADSSYTIGQAGVAVSHANVDVAAGAPGPGGVGGSNTATISQAAMPTHNHGGSSWTGWSDLGLLWYNDADVVAHAKAGNFEKVTHPAVPGGQPCHGAGGWNQAQHRHKLESISTEGSNAVHDNRPSYVGLIWIMKVKNID